MSDVSPHQATQRSPIAPQVVLLVGHQVDVTNGMLLIRAPTLQRQYAHSFPAAVEFGVALMVLRLPTSRDETLPIVRSMAEVSSVSIDQEAGAAYLALADAPVARSVDHGAFVADYDANGQVVGIEVLTLHQAPPVPAIMDAISPADSAVRERVGSFAEQIRGLEDTPSALGNAEHDQSEQRKVNPTRAPLKEVRFLTIVEVATILRVPKLTVYRMIRSGALPAIRVGRSYRVPERAVHDYLRATETRLDAMRST